MIDNPFESGLVVAMNYIVIGFYSTIFEEKKNYNYTIIFLVKKSSKRGQKNNENAPPDAPDGS